MVNDSWKEQLSVARGMSFRANVVAKEPLNPHPPKYHQLHGRALMGSKPGGELVER